MPKSTKTATHCTSTNLTIFDLSKEMTELAQLLLDLEGSPEAQDSAIRAALMDEDSPLDDVLVSHQMVKQKALVKLNNICGLIRFLENSRDARKAHANMVRDRARIDDNNIQRLKKLAIWFMTEHKMNRIETLEYRISHYEAQPCLELLVDPENLPDEYVEVEEKTIYKAQIDKIKAALKAGVISVQKLAKLCEPSQILKISKPKKEKEATEE